VLALWLGLACHAQDEPASPDGTPATVSNELGARCSSSSQCNDGNACTIDRCRSGRCRSFLAANGTSCSDGNACTFNETCQSGVCTASSTRACSGEGSCNLAGTCDPASGLCNYPSKADGTVCDDGSLCTASDSCRSGVCTGASQVTCTQLDACHAVGTCDRATGVCSQPSVANGTACSDGSACTQTDTCQSGVCQAGSKVACTAIDECHEAGTCDPATGTCSAGAPIACSAPAPRPQTPLSGATLSTQRPTLRWILPLSGSDGAAIDLCRDRACTMVEQTLVATGSSLALDVDLPTGTWYWRLRGRLGTTEGTSTSAVWSFTVGSCVSGSTTAKTQVADVNGDGWLDTVKGGGYEIDNATGKYKCALHIYLGSASGTSTTPDKTVYHTTAAKTDQCFGYMADPMGDLDGDGYSDVLAVRHSEYTPVTLTLFRGDGTGLMYAGREWWSSSECTPPWPIYCDVFWASQRVSGDFNADGSTEYAYSDTYWYEYDLAQPGEVYLSSTSPSSLVRPLAAGEYSSRDGFGSRLTVIDYNCDGYDDLMVYASTLAKNYIFLGSATGLSTAPAVTL
jgi:hypothetical protein